MKKPLIPFGWLPGHWGLSGQTRKIAEIEYKYQHDPYLRDKKIILIKQLEAKSPEVSRQYDLELIQHEYNHNKIDLEEYERRMLQYSGKDDKQKKIGFLELDLRHNRISQEDYDFGMLEAQQADLSKTDYELQLNELNFKHHRIRELDYEKKKSTLQGESWVSVLNIETKEGMGNFELDWNDHFVAELKAAGFKGEEDEDIVNQWFSRICRDIALEEFSGTGNFDEELAEKEYIKRKKIEDGKWEVK